MTYWRKRCSRTTAFSRTAPHLLRSSQATKRSRQSKPARPDQEKRMTFDIGISSFVALYIFMLAGFTGWVVIGRVPAILHTPLMSGSNFVHGIVVAGGLFALLNASTSQEQIIGFFAVLLGSGNAAGGYIVTKRMLAMLQPSIALHKHGVARHAIKKTTRQKPELL